MGGESRGVMRAADADAAAIGGGVKGAHNRETLQAIVPSFGDYGMSFWRPFVSAQGASAMGDTDASALEKINRQANEAKGLRTIKVQ